MNTINRSEVGVTMEVEVCGKMETRECEINYGSVYDTIPSYGACLEPQLIKYKPILKQGEMLMETVGGSMIIVQGVE
jgi:hypothetical protein